MTGLHLTNNGSLRAAILGANDGLVSNFILVMGVAGGSDNPQFVLLAGIAGLFAGAFSMAAGEYVSMRSQRDVYEYQTPDGFRLVSRHPPSPRLAGAWPTYAH